MPCLLFLLASSSAPLLDALDGIIEQREARALSRVPRRERTACPAPGGSALFSLFFSAFMQRTIPPTKALVSSSVAHAPPRIGMGALVLQPLGQAVDSLVPLGMTSNHITFPRTLECSIESPWVEHLSFVNPQTFFSPPLSSFWLALARLGPIRIEKKTQHTKCRPCIELCRIRL